MFEARTTTSFIAHFNYMCYVVVNLVSAVVMVAYTNTLVIYAVL